MEWIKCSDSLPSDQKYVLVYSSSNYPHIFLDWRDGKSWMKSLGKVTHWMQIPPDPLEELE